MCNTCPGPTTPEEYLRFGLHRFRSPLLTVSISLSLPPLTEMFHFSGCRVHNPMDSGYDDGGLTPSGYPIRIPPGLSSLAALRGFSQLVASFFACWHQGIHHKPLSSFIETHGDSLLKSFRVAIFFLERISFVCLILVLCALFLGNCFSHKIVGVAIFSDYNL